MFRPIVNVLLGAALPLLASCDQGPAPDVPTDEVGVVSLPLLSSNADGDFKITAGTLTLRQDGVRDPIEIIGDLSADTVTRTLKAGDYSVSLDGWELSQGVGGTWTPVEAVLVSSANQHFQVRPGRAVEVLFRFMPLATQGDVNVGIGVNTGFWVTGVFSIDSVSHYNGPTGPLDVLVGLEVPFDVYFIADAETPAANALGKWVDYTTSPVRYAFEGTEPFLGVLGAELTGIQAAFARAMTNSGDTEGRLGWRADGFVDGSGEFFSFGLNGDGMRLDANGYPVLGLFDATNGTVFVRRGMMAGDLTWVETDVALGTVTFSLLEGP